MQITNNYNLPQALVTIATDDSHKPHNNDYSATTILGSIREILLTRRHYDEIEEDVSDLINVIFGTATHHILELANKDNLVELKLMMNVFKDYNLTGRCDIYNENDLSLEDYKTSSIYKVLKQDFEDYKKQGLCYALMLRKMGKLVTKLRFHILIKDWSRRDYELSKLSDKWYPEHPIWTWEYEILEKDLENITEFINLKFSQLYNNINKSDNELPNCTDEERWNDGIKYAVYKDNAKRATKVFDNKNDAQELVNQIGGHIEERIGEDKKCMNYCTCKKYCNYYKENYGI